MTKKEILEKIKNKEARRDKLIARSEKTEDIEELRSINEQVEEIKNDITELRSWADSLPDDEQQEQREQEEVPAEKRGGAAAPQGAFNPMGTYGMGQAQQRSEQKPKDVYDTLEYRTAFMEFARTGKVTPELRADAMTTTADISAVIPTTILNEIIKQVKVYGQVFARVRKLNIKGGVKVPILSVKPVATWIGENTTSNKQKTESNTSVEFSYYGLECKVSQSLLADTVSLDSFESTIVDLITEAMVKAIDLGVVKGTGSGQMLGITVDSRVPAGNKVTLSSEDFQAWDQWKKKVFAKLKLGYKSGAIFLMASGTFEGYIDGMTDANGQPIGRVNYGIDKGPTGRFGGREVIEVEDDVIANYDDASTGDVVAIYCNLKNYTFNSNMQMTMFRYFDHDTNEWIDKAILIADGKLLDANGVVIVKKGA